MQSGGISNPLFFIGVIENNIDTRGEGRCQVRAFGIHGNNDQVPRDLLPWAIVAQGGYDPNVVPKLNSWVYGMFLDGRDAQQPMILGLVPTQMTEKINPKKNGWGWIPDKDGDLVAKGSEPSAIGDPQNSALLRGERTEETYVLAQEMGRTLNVPVGGTEETWSEPAAAYNTQYPHNKVIESGSHTIELDDTKGAERIMIHHKSGSFIQIDSRGTKTNKTVSDQYDVIDRKQHVIVGGMSTVTIMGNSYVYVKGNKIEEIEGDLSTIVHGEHHLAVGGQSTINAGEQVQIRGADVRMQANVGTLSIKAGKELQLDAGIGTYMKSKRLWVQSTDRMDIKALNMFTTVEEELNIFAPTTKIFAETQMDLKSAVLNATADGKLSLRASTVAIDDIVTMANGAAVTAEEAIEGEESINAVAVEAPEPPTKSTSVQPPTDQGSRGSNGYSSRDHDSNGGSNNTDVPVNDVTAATQTAATPLLDLIGNAESNGYDDISGLVKRRKPSQPITELTIQEILDWQESIDRFQLSEAVGRYQIMEDTLRGYDNDRTVGPGNPLAKRAGLTNSSLFSPENQDKLALALLNYRGLTKFLNGEITRDQFANNLASEWAALPLVTGSKKGLSKYDKDAAGNSARVTVNKLLEAIDQVGSRHTSLKKAALPGDPTIFGGDQ